VNRTKSFGRLLLAGLLAMAAPLPAAADDIFLKLIDVRGESVDAHHKGEIDVLSYTQSMTGPFAPTTAGGAAAGKTPCGQVTITKYVDVSSPDLMQSAAEGRHFKGAVVTFRRPGQNPIEYYQVTLEDVIVTEVQQNDRSGSSERAVERVSLMGRKFRYYYNGQSPTGAAAKPWSGWDCVANSRG
jgi:type VI secretion system secreted protein Hcp